MIARQATQKDYQEICRILAYEMQPEIGFGAVDWDKGADHIRHVMQSGIVWLACTDEGEIAGTVGLLQNDKFWWSREEFVADQWFYVRLQFRKSRAFFLLMKQVEFVAKCVRIPVLLAISSPIEFETKGRLFERYGEKMGIYYKIRHGGAYVR